MDALILRALKQMTREKYVTFAKKKQKHVKGAWDGEFGKHESTGCRSVRKSTWEWLTRAFSMIPQQFIRFSTRLAIFPRFSNERSPSPSPPPTLPCLPSPQFTGEPSPFLSFYYVSALPSWLNRPAYFLSDSIAWLGSTIR